MQRKTARLYQAGEFAERAGVTVRTPHHYDEFGLLKPSAHTEAGYRLYDESDLARMQQITALRFVEPSLQERIFERFYRTSTTGDGLGLGLSIGRWIARAHGGDLRASNSTGKKGATFIVRLPALPTPAS